MKENWQPDSVVATTGRDMGDMGTAGICAAFHAPTCTLLSPNTRISWDT